MSKCGMIGCVAIAVGMSSCSRSVTPQIGGGQRRLVDAAWRHDVATVTALAEEGMDVNASGEHGQTAIEGAAWHGDERVVDALLRAGAIVSVPPGRALQFAAVRGHSAVVRRLLAAGADPDARDSSGRSSLSLAALGGHAAVVAALLDAGAETELRSDTGMTALMYAVAHGHGAVTTMLVRRGANVAAQRDDGSTPWTMAVERNDMRMMQVLQLAKTYRVSQRRSSDGGRPARRTGTLTLGEAER